MNDGNRGAFKESSPAEIVFNHQGLYQNLEGDRALFQQLPLPDGPESQFTLRVKRFAIFNIDAQFNNRCLTMSFIYNRIIRNIQQIQYWTIQYKTTIGETLHLLGGRATK